jgi:hypothetical protein
MQGVNPKWYNETVMKRSIFGISTFLGIIALGLLVFCNTAGAYALGTNGSAPPIATGTVAGYVSQAQRLMDDNSSLPSTPSWLSDALNAASRWFQNIMAQGAQSTGAPTPVTISGPLGSITVSAQNLLAQFDAWLYGIIHFHIALVFNFIFGLVIWILGIAKDVAVWLNSIFKSAAGR